jgi:hypothetical protein
MNPDYRHPCQICGEPATRTVTDHEQLPDETFWQVDVLSPPWHLCDNHSWTPEKCRERLTGMLSRVDGALTQLDNLAEDIRDTETMTRAGDARELLLQMQTRIEAGLCKLAES